MASDFGLVVITDIMGTRPLFTDMRDRLARDHGWDVRVVDPFRGREDVSLEDRLAMATAELDDASVIGDAVAAADDTGAERVGIIGFCMGGMYALKAAGTGRFSAAVAFYGMIRVPEQFRGPGQGEPLEALASPDASPVLAIIGALDPWTPPADVDALRATGAEVVVYPEADHGFVHDASRPSHRADDAADAWRRAIAFLRA